MDIIWLQKKKFFFFPIFLYTKKKKINSRWFYLHKKTKHSEFNKQCHNHFKWMSSKRCCWFNKVACLKSCRKKRFPWHSKWHEHIFFFLLLYSAIRIHSFYITMDVQVSSIRMTVLSPWIVDQSEYLSCGLSWIFSDLPGRQDIRRKKTNTQRDHVRYTVQDKVRFLDQRVYECISQSAGCARSNCAERWSSKLRAPDRLLEHCEKVGRRSILTKEHQTTVINLTDTHPSATVVQVTKHVLKRCTDLKQPYL